MLYSFIFRKPGWAKNKGAMKMRQTLWIAAAMTLVLLFAQGAVAEKIENNAIVMGDEAVKAGTTPDSFFYFLDKFMDDRALKSADNDAEKSRIGLRIAKERLLEARQMLESNKAKAAQKAQQEHSRVLSIVELSVQGIENNETLEQIEAEMKIEMELEEHDGETEFVKNELKLRLESEGRLTPAQRVLIDSLLDSMKNQTGKVKVKIEEKRDESIIRLKAETGKSDSEIEREITEIETRTGLREIKIEKAQDKLDDAAEELAEAKLSLAGANATSANLTAAMSLIAEAEKKLANAQSAFDEGKHGEAFGLANAAENLAKNAKRMLHGFEEDDARREEKLEIKANVMNASSSIRVKLEFVSTENDRQKIAEEILGKLRLSSERLSAILKIEAEDDELADRRKGADKPEDDNDDDKGNRPDSMEAEARIRDGISRVEFELRFPLNATNRSEIASGISERLSRLTAGELAASFDIRLKEDGEKEDTNEREIEVEVEDGIAKIKVESGDSRLRYSMPFVSEADVVKDIAAKTGLTEQDVRSLMELKTEADDEDENELADRRRGADKPEDDNDDDDSNGRGRGRG